MAVNVFEVDRLACEFVINSNLPLSRPTILWRDKAIQSQDITQTHVG